MNGNPTHFYKIKVKYDHLTVNHSENLVDQLTRPNTQTIKCIWSHLKMKILRKMHGITSKLLHSHLIEA